MIKLLIFSILAGFVSGQAADLSPRFVKALHMVETSGRLGSILGDDGAALGPYRYTKLTGWMLLLMIKQLKVIILIVKI